MIPTLTGAIFVLVGVFMLKFPPKNINSLYGYRTSSSMKSDERWIFAQKYSAKEFIKLGLILMVIGSVGIFVYPNENLATGIGMGLMTIGIITIIVRVERAIKRKFGQD
ncbi:SdpI family protein [Brumimicrobium oceani]|nr:SdpI family protein [Brumimicrobium oceani]